MSEIKWGLTHFYQGFQIKAAYDGELMKWKAFAKGRGVAYTINLESDWKDTERESIQQIYQYVDNFRDAKPN